jgi:tripartite-type tricarboxylate transporter receptor subunit TctC
MITRILGALALVALCAGGAGSAGAAYPEKPIKFIVPYAPGGASDIVARLMQKALEGVLSQPTVIINKPGAGGALGAREVKDAEPDGYTVLSTHIALHTTHLMGQADFDYTAFEPVAETGAIELIMTVPRTSPFKTIGDMVAAAKAKPNTVTHATNLTSVLHLAVLQMMDVIGFEFRIVQVGGGGARKPHMVGGHSDTSYFGIGEVKQEIETGDLRVLALMSRERTDLLPDVPSIKEAGWDYSPLGVAFWWVVPKGTPADRVKVLADAFETAMGKAETKKALDDRAYKPTFIRGEAFAKKVADEYESVKALVEKAGLAKK